MSDREMVSSLLDELPEYKLDMVMAYIQGLLDDEAEDDAFCEKLYQEYQNDPDIHKSDSVTIEELASRLGVRLE